MGYVVLKIVTCCLIVCTLLLLLFYEGQLGWRVKVTDQKKYNVGIGAQEKETIEEITFLENRNISVYKNENLPYNVTDKLFHLFSVLAHQDENNIWDKLFFTGWELSHVQKRKYKCCYMFGNGTVVDGISAYKNRVVLGSGRGLQARQVVFDTRALTMKEKPKWAAIILLNEYCQDVKTYHTIVYRHRENTKQFAIGVKILYRQNDAIQLIEWMEYHKHLGVSRVVVYTYPDLNARARKVLSHYEMEGVLEAVSYPYVPLLDKFPRYFGVQNSTVMWQDEKIALLDTEQRLRPYTYLGVIDTDEFIILRRENVTTLVELMDYLLNKTENGGTFKLHSEEHFFDWNKTNNNSHLQIGQYGYHTEPVTTSFKNLHVTSRVQEGAIWTHHTLPRHPFSRVVPSPKDEVVLKHFRKCFSDWKNCPEGIQKYLDDDMSTIAQLIEPKVMELRSKLGL